VEITKREKKFEVVPVVWFKFILSKDLYLLPFLCNIRCAPNPNDYNGLTILLINIFSHLFTLFLSLTHTPYILSFFISIYLSIYNVQTFSIRHLYYIYIYIYRLFTSAKNDKNIVSTFFLFSMIISENMTTV